MVDETKTAVPIGVSSFSDELPDLSTFSLEEVVARFKDVEKRRTAHVEPDSEQEVYWMIRRAPVELMSSLRIVSARLGISRSVLTKCMSRQVADWYANSLGLDKLSGEYNEIYNKIKLKGYTTLRIQAENPAKFSYHYQPEEAHASITTIRWMLAKLSDIREVVGVYAVDLFLVGLAWSLTTLENSDWDASNIDSIFRPEADSIRVLVQDRLIDIRSLYAKYNLREGV